VADTTRSLIRLSCSTRELTLLEPFTETHFVAVDPLELDYPFDPILLWLYVTPEEALLSIDEERVLPGELAVGRSARVQDIGGGYMGSVDKFLVDSANECTPTWWFARDTRGTRRSDDPHKPSCTDGGGNSVSQTGQTAICRLAHETDSSALVVVRHVTSGGARVLALL
jgi:hypothetical protein